METSYWREWPVCPQCGRRRQTECPVCGIAGNDFPLAEYQAVAEPIRSSRRGLDVPAAPSEVSPPDSSRSARSEADVLLHCPQCDEVFVPRFYRRCPECGHDHGQGIQILEWQPDPLSHRELITIAALLLLAALTVFYFWSLFSS